MLSKRKDMLSTILKVILGQMILVMHIVKVIRNIYIIIFYQLSFELPAIMLTKILKRKVVLYLGGSGALSTFYSSNFTFFKFLRLNRFAYAICYNVEKVNLKLADRLIVVAPELAEMYRQEKYKVIPALAIDENFLEHFKLKRRISERRLSVAYIGRLTREKGILEFILSIPIVVAQNSTIDFLIIGDGDLLPTIKSIIGKLKIEEKCKLIGAVPHQYISEYLNNIRLLVLPSYTEGLPSLLLEALACGTPVLVTPVGHVKSIITDGKNGFLLLNNKPKTIAQLIVTILSNENLLKAVSEEAIKKFRQLYKTMSLDSSVRLWKEIITELLMSS
jgi:glycosyltransferase involved in cell wall biosynthesis